MVIRFLILVLVMMGWNFGNAALLLTGVFIPAFSFCCALIVMQQRKLIRVRRVCVDGACEGERVEVKLTVQNRHWFPIFRLLVEDHFEPEMEAEQYFSADRCIARSTASGFRPRPLTLK